MHAKGETKNLIFLDEVGVNLAMTPTCGRAIVGKRAYSSRPGNRGKNISIISTISDAGQGAYYPYDGAINGERLVDFIETHLTLTPSDVLVMDNVPFHHSKIVKDAVEKTGAEILYVPPYSPELNPIEESFSVMKRFLRRLRPRNISQLIPALEKAFGLVTPEKIAGFYRHTFRFAKALHAG